MSKPYARITAYNETVTILAEEVAEFVDRELFGVNHSVEYVELTDEEFAAIPEFDGW